MLKKCNLSWLKLISDGSKINLERVTADVLNLRALGLSACLDVQFISGHRLIRQSGVDTDRKGEQQTNEKFDSEVLWQYLVV